MRLYLVVMQGVYDQGTVGAFANIDEARKHIARVAADSDRHHDFRIEEIDTGVGYWPEKRYLRADDKEFAAHEDHEPRLVDVVRL